MNQKFSKEVSNPQYRDIFNNTQNITLDNIKTLDKHMMEQFKFLHGYLPNVKLTQDIEGQTNIALLHYYYSILSEETFPFILNQQIFEWKTFEKENNQNHAKDKLAKIF